MFCFSPGPIGSGNPFVQPKPVKGSIIPAQSTDCFAPEILVSITGRSESTVPGYEVFMLLCFPIKCFLPAQMRAHAESRQKGYLDRPSQASKKERPSIERDPFIVQTGMKTEKMSLAVLCQHELMPVNVFRISLVLLCFRSRLVQWSLAGWRNQQLHITWQRPEPC
jgi:hypothetical protein